ncbi:hypothetical protein PHISCL_09001 [Aspergillus sclerotialis]|uniref:Peptidyl-tRNA hydrolase n=1 Tax=Aspergillus sclerotialis TaxID=2070753 RepID=A0A3A2ZLA4_9EURO|nr:hypothetical protein PHISCL_09001 [Aspergillus sclerotialis]
MRFLLFLGLALLTVLATAQDQVPLGDRVQGWFNKAKSYIPTATPVVPPQKVAEKVIPAKDVTPFTLDTWQSAWSLRPSRRIADKNSPNLGRLNCEENQVLCSAWSAGAPSVWYFKVPQAQLEGRAETPLHITYMNSTTITAEGMFKIYSEKKYERSPPYQGFLHPTDGLLAQYGLGIPVGYLIYGLSAIPSWAFMVGISFMSRTIMGRRVGNQAARNPPPRQN